LDIDNLENAQESKEKASQLPWVHAIFITASGKGLKIIIRTNATTKTYKIVEENVAAMILEKAGLERDRHCKDIARIQYISHDPELYYNPESEVCVVKIEETVTDEN
jgi:porphobilinogen deaminase